MREEAREREGEREWGKSVTRTEINCACERVNTEKSSKLKCNITYGNLRRYQKLVSISHESSGQGECRM